VAAHTNPEGRWGKPPQKPISIWHLTGVVAITWWLAVEPAREQSDESLEQWVIRTRIEQGLPPHVEEIETLRSVIALLGLGDHQKEHK
jgi:hypothetical protein